MKKVLLNLTLFFSVLGLNAQETVIEDFTYTVTDQASFDAALANFPLFNGPNWAFSSRSHWISYLGSTTTATNTYGLAGFPVGEKVIASRVYNSTTGKGPVGTTPKDSIGGFIGKQITLTAGNTFKVKFDVSPARLVTYDVLNVDLVEYTPANVFVGVTPLGTKTFTSADFGKKTIEYNIPLPTTLTNKFYLVFNHTVTQLDPANQTAGGYLGGLILDKIILVKTPLSNEAFSTLDFTFFPNPVVDFLNISNNNNLDIKNISVTDINGRIVKTSNSNEIASAKIDLSDLTAGIYIMKIETDKGISTEKIIKK